MTNTAQGSFDIDRWVGRRQESHDTVSPVQVRQMAATLDDAERLREPGGAPLPAGWHWLYFNPLEVQSRLGEDGHLQRGDFLPPVALPRRMWAGSRLQWRRAFTVGREVHKASEILSVSRKHGRSGEMVFVTVGHHYSDEKGLLLDEEHDIVYREAPGSAEREALAKAGRRIVRGEHAFERQGEFMRKVRADEVLLFRYSAATFNGHRIHYDLDYCREVEGYPGLVVHGPLIATLLLDFLERELLARMGATFVIGFQFRALRPTFHLTGFHLHARTEAPGEGSNDATGSRQVALWSTNNLGEVGLDALATVG